MSDPFRIEQLDPRMAEIYRGMSVAERLAAGFQMTEFIRASLRARLRAEHPEWSDAAVDAEVAQRILHRHG